MWQKSNKAHIHFAQFWGIYSPLQRELQEVAGADDPLLGFFVYDTFNREVTDAQDDVADLKAAFGSEAARRHL